MLTNSLLVVYYTSILTRIPIWLIGMARKLRQSKIRAESI